ncbi:hypothetical protein CW752_04135 [Chryseobacterium sp. PMSZPI]|nr:hypothetical protein CW752_04135 [Chryseobacterium sp. PMSZPI]
MIMKRIYFIVDFCKAKIRKKRNGFILKSVTFIEDKYDLSFLILPIISGYSLITYGYIRYLQVKHL